jgi:hypothetical protein
MSAVTASSFPMTSRSEKIGRISPAAGVRIYARNGGPERSQHSPRALHRHVDGLRASGKHGARQGIVRAIRPCSHSSVIEDQRNDCLIPMNIRQRRRRSRTSTACQRDDAYGRAE